MSKMWKGQSLCEDVSRSNANGRQDKSAAGRGDSIHQTSVKITLNGGNTQMTVDSGASANIMDEKRFDEKRFK